ncbi:hypothetical protein BCV70DRAFT_214510 [Testicularia cyperi]|uniref:L-serine ammonia-lyase n=1 Tax=Testicularia cyperi TaxID=1882483 RepID=A0A317XZ22_9BASI|nr:hypothetical protein BCV70DRAFT_214510 [Testicularia cyperi]
MLTFGDAVRRCEAVDSVSTAFAMLPSLALNASTVDHFRKNIYRPRLCLLLLLVLLSPHNAPHLASHTTDVSVSQPASQAWSISIIDGLVVAAPPSTPKAHVSLSTPQESSVSPAKLHDTGNDHSYTDREGDAAEQAAPSPAPSPKSIAAEQASQPPPGSLFRFPKLSWGLLIDSHVLPALLPLHILWAARLTGMAVEDGIVRASLLGAKSRFHSVVLPSLYLLVLVLVSIGAAHPMLVQTLKECCQVWRASLGIKDALSLDEDPSSAPSGPAQTPLLPLQLIVTLEAAATLVSLLSIYLKIEGTPFSRHVVKDVKLPSPSHSPSLIELLPLPPSLKAAWFGSLPARSAGPYARGRSRRPMMPSLAGSGDDSAAAQPQNERASQDNTSPQEGQGPIAAAGLQVYDNAVSSSMEPVAQQTYRRVGAPESEVLRSTSVAQPIAPLRLPDLPPSDSTDSTAGSIGNGDTSNGQVDSQYPSRRRRAPRMQGQSVLVSSRWLSDTLVALFDKVVGSLLYAIVTLRLPTLSPTSLPPVLSLLSLRSELASVTTVWTKARASVECLEFVRRRWGVRLVDGKDPYTSTQRPRAARALGDYAWKSYEDVYCAICFELTRPASRQAPQTPSKAAENSSETADRVTQKAPELTDSPAHEFFLASRLLRRSVEASALPPATRHGRSLAARSLQYGAQQHSTTRGLLSVAHSARRPSALRSAGFHSSSRSASIVKASEPPATTESSETEHAVISTFDLFSIGIGPSSSHTVGPMRAGVIFVSDLADMGLLDRVHTLKVNLYGSLALTGEGHMTPQALLGGLEGDDCETVDPPSVPVRFDEIRASKKLYLGKNLYKTLGSKPGEKPVEGKLINFDYDADLKWMFGQVLPHHSNGIRMSVFDDQGEMLATNDYYSVGGGFVVNGALATPANSSSSSVPPSTASTGPASDSTTSTDTDGAVSLHGDTPEVSAHPIDWGENIFYKQIRRKDAEDGRRSGSAAVEGILPQVEVPAGQIEGSVEGVSPSLTKADGEAPEKASPGHEAEKLTARPSSGPPFPFHNAASLLRQCKTRNLTIAQVVYENELTWNPPEVVHDKLFKIWATMDDCIRAGVENTEPTLPGPLAVRRRAPQLYARLLRGLYRAPSLTSGFSQRPGSSQKLGSASSSPAEDGPGIDSRPSHSSAASNTGTDMVSQMGSAGLTRSRVIGSFNHPVMPCPPRRTNFPAIDYLSCYAIATNEQNAAGGRIVTAPTNGAAGVLPSVLKYCFEFIFDDDPVRDLQNFLLTAAAIGMLFKRGATLSAAEGGCMAEVGVATAMAAAGFVSVLGGSPEKVLQASVIGIEHNLGLTCDPLNGQVQIPCIERNALGAVKAVTAAQLALAGDGKHSVSLDDAITAMRETARDMHTSYKETSLGGLATAVKVPVAVPDC